MCHLTEITTIKKEIILEVCWPAVAFLFWPEQQAYYKDDVLYIEQNSDEARKLIRLSNMLLTHWKTRCLLLCFQFKLGHFFSHLTTKLTILKTKWEFRFMYGHVLNIEYIEALKTSSYIHNMCSLLNWYGCWPEMASE